MVLKVKRWPPVMFYRRASQYLPKWYDSIWKDRGKWKPRWLGVGFQAGLDDQLILLLFFYLIHLSRITRWSVLLHDNEDYTRSVTVFSDQRSWSDSQANLGCFKATGFVNPVYLLRVFLFCFVFFRRANNVLRDENVFTHSTAWERAERRPCK